MRVLIVFSSSELGGAERSLSRMAFASKKVEYQLATLSGAGPWCDWVRSEGLEPLVLGQKKAHVGSLFVAVWRLILHVRSHPVDIIYICGARGSLFLRLFRFLIPATRLVHGVRWNPDTNTRLDRFFRFMEKITYRLIDAWITNSAVTKQTLLLRCGIPAERIFVIYNGLEFLPSNVPPFTDRFMEVLTVANLSLRKGHIEYLQVIRKVLDTLPDAKFIFIGRDDMDGKVEQTIREVGLSGSVQYEGFQNDISPWLNRARLMVLPSLWGEGCPTSILEGFAFGLPVVAYGIDGIPELIENERDGFILSPEKPDELASTIVSILKNPVKAENMGATGRDKVIIRFTLKRCIEEHAQIFRKVISLKN